MVVQSNVAALLALLLPSLASANPVDNYSARAIAESRLMVAERHLEQAVREDALDEAALLNLALVYRQQGRIGEAAKLYRRVLASNDVRLGTLDGRNRWAHEMAREGLANTLTIAAR